MFRFSPAFQQIAPVSTSMIKVRVAKKYTLGLLLRDWQALPPKKVPQHWMLIETGDCLNFAYFGDKKEIAMRSVLVSKDMKVELRVENRPAHFPSFDEVKCFEDFRSIVEIVSQLNICAGSDANSPCPDGFYAFKTKLSKIRCSKCCKNWEENMEHRSDMRVRRRRKESSRNGPIVRRCVAFACNNSSMKEFRLFEFPKDPEVRQTWLRNINRPSWTPSISARLCEAHFEISEFVGDKLRPDAAPTLFGILQRETTLDLSTTNCETSFDISEFVRDKSEKNSGFSFFDVLQNEGMLDWPAIDCEANNETVEVKTEYFQLKNICRICLEETADMIPLLTRGKLSEDNLELTIQEGIQQAFSITISVDPKLPDYICEKCTSLAISAYQFRHTYESSNEFFMSTLKTPKHFDGNPVSLESVSEPEIEEINLEEISNVMIKSKLHVCPICDKEFTAFDLRMHVRLHHLFDAYLKIPRSQRVRQNQRFYSNNVQGVTSFVPGEYQCVYCSKMFKNVRILKNHLAQHETEGFECKECDRFFLKLQHLKTHQMSHVKEFPYNCDDCGEKFITKKTYDCHILMHKNGERLSAQDENCATKNYFKCSKCLKSFKEKNDRIRHACKPINHLKTRYQCDMCPKFYKTSSALSSHKRSVHLNKKYLCPVCGKYLARLHGHMQSHRPKAKRDKCHVCDKRFTQRASLKRHLLLHCDIKPFVCQFCGQRCRDQFNLQTHEKTHTKVGRHICGVCGQSFVRRFYLQAHLAKHSELNTP